MGHEPWKASMTRIPANPELLTWAREQQQEAARLDATIEANLRELGYGE